VSRFRRSTSLYPRSWRDRYGEELEDLLVELQDAGQPTWRLATGITLSAIREWARRVSRRTVVGGSTIAVGACALILLGVFGPLRHPATAPTAVSRPIHAPTRGLSSGYVIVQYETARGGLVVIHERTGRIIALASPPSTAP
jgi:hypothetical protein